MKAHRKLAVVIATCGLGFVPAVALASTPGNHGSSQNAPGHTGTQASKAKKYGKFCQSEIRTHVKGQKGTPFSNCVNAMAKLANGSSTNAKGACATEVKKHVKGQKGTPYSDCVSAAAKLRRSQNAQNSSS